jgi:hypothetical protein
VRGFDDVSQEHNQRKGPSARAARPRRSKAGGRVVAATQADDSELTKTARASKEARGPGRQAGVECSASQRAFRFRTLVPRRSVVACLWRILRLQREEPTRLRGGAFGIFGSGYDWRCGLPRLSPPTQKVVARSMKLQVDKWTSVCVVKPLAEATLSR